MDKMLILQRATIFQALGYDEMLRLAHIAEQRSYAAGEKVIEDGAPAHHVYVVGSGAAEVRKGERVLARLGVGASFGEMALVDDAPRSAAVVMVEEGVVLSLHRDVFRALVRDHPEMYEDLCRLFVRRLRDAANA